MKAVADWLSLTGFTAGILGVGQIACRLLMINKFHHCHSKTMVTKTEAVCQLNLLILPQNYLKMQLHWVVIELKNTHCQLLGWNIWKLEHLKFYHLFFDFFFIIRILNWKLENFDETLDLSPLVQYYHYDHFHPKSNRPETDCSISC